MTTICIVGEVEWVRFVGLTDSLELGNIVGISSEWESPGASAAVAAVQLAKLGAKVTLVSPFGEDPAGSCARSWLANCGIKFVDAPHVGVQRRSTALLDPSGERSIFVDQDPAPEHRWPALNQSELSEIDAVLFCGGPARLLEQTRQTPLLIIAARAHATAERARISVDAIVGSGLDIDDRFSLSQLKPEGLWVRTLAEQGGSFGTGEADGESFSPMPLSGAALDSYGCGASFLAGLTYGLAYDFERKAAVALAATCGAACKTGRGPFAGQIDWRNKERNLCR
jgi:ribokinase